MQGCGRAHHRQHLVDRPERILDGDRLGVDRWATCHHDAKNMPDTPDAAAIDASEFKERLDFTGGVTKYIKESRSKIEVKGRRGKKRGGWDKLVDADAIKGELEANKFMDIIRYQAGTGVLDENMRQTDCETGQFR